MINALRPFFARFAASIVAGLAVWLGSTFGIELSNEDTEAISAAAITVMFVVYSIVHKLVSKWTNPGDAAAPKLIKKEVAETERLNS